jgi:uncharacterized protein
VSIAVHHVAERKGLRASVKAASAETLLALGTFGLIAVHLVDDSFLQPEPGTGIVDHLGSGLVPLAVLAAAAVAYPRLRPGLRAALAVVVGIFGIVSGAVEPAYYGPKEGLSGDDFSGLVAAVAGLCLVILGVVTAWRGRKQDQPLA